MLDYSTLTVAIKHLASYLLWMRSQYNTVNNKLYKHKHNITPPPPKKIVHQWKGNFPKLKRLRLTLEI